MSEIPEDIMKVAAEIAEPRHIAPRKQDLANEIARAILAERERCALVALCHADNRPRRYGMDWNDGYMDACKGAHDAIIASNSKT